MSICDSGYRGFPTMAAFKSQAAIPEEERCTSCMGLGTIRWRYSVKGGGLDWKECWRCRGTGRKEKELDETK